MENTYVVSVFDEGLERNFLCTFAMLSPDGIFMISEGVERHYATSAFISIESVRRAEVEIMV
jgi:hypothetical protein